MKLTKLEKLLVIISYINIIPMFIWLSNAFNQPIFIKLDSFMLLVTGFLLAVFELTFLMIPPYFGLYFQEKFNNDLNQ